MAGRRGRRGRLRCSSTEEAEARIGRRTWVWIGIIVLGIYGLSPVVSNGDSFLVAPTTASLISDRDLDISEFAGVGTTGGLAWIGDGSSGQSLSGFDLPAHPGFGTEPIYDLFPWTTAVMVVPLYLLLLIPGQGLGIAFFDPRRMSLEGDSGLFNLIGGSILTTATVIVVAATAGRLLEGRVHPSVRSRTVVLVALVVAFGTSAWSVLSRALWSQSSATLLLATALYAAVRLEQADGLSIRRWAAVMGVASGLAFTARPTSVVATVAFGIWILVCHGRRAILWYVSAGSVIAAVWIAVNMATWGTALPPYFAGERAAPETYVLEGIVGNLFSPSRGLFVFSPIAVLSVAGSWMVLRKRSRSPLTMTLVAMVVAHWLIVSATGEVWWGGATYGPRFMADVIPFLVVLAVPAIARIASLPPAAPMRRAAIALVVVSVLMHAPGATSKPAHCWNLHPRHIDDDPSRVWDWARPQTLEPFRVLLETGSPREVFLGRCDDHLERPAPATA